MIVSNHTSGGVLPSVVLGGVASILIIGVYVAGLLANERADVFRALLYNAPIAFLFLVLAAEATLRVFAVGPRRALAERSAIAMVWLLGAIILYLRLVSRSVEISGHMVWLPLLVAHAFVLGFPRWFMAIAVLAFVVAAWLKFAVFRGPSGAPGLIIGAVLSLALLAWHRWGEHRTTETAS